MPVNAIRRKEVFEMIPEGGVATRKWLMKKGLSRHALDNLIKSEQLKSVVNGVYTRAGSKLTWQGIVFSLQSILHLPFVVGGLTALEMQGLAHYLSMSDKKTIHLYGSEKLPQWVNAMLPDVTFVRHSEDELLGINKSKDKRSNTSIKDVNSLKEFTVLQTWKEGLEALVVSSQERSYLELLMEVPQKISFEHADQLMQGLTSLSPRSLQKLLEQCRNIKVRRLFFWFAERHNYTWLQKLEPKKIDMGTGNRMLFKGGILNKKYKITVPEYL